MPMPSATDPQVFKAAVRNQWDQSAAGWDRHTPAIAAWLTDATEAMFDMAGIVAGSRVLDVAAGAGDQTLGIARRVGPRGFVLATDLSPAILALAKGHAVRQGSITWRPGSRTVKPGWKAPASTPPYAGSG